MKRLFSLFMVMLMLLVPFTSQACESPTVKSLVSFTPAITWEYGTEESLFSKFYPKWVDTFLFNSEWQIIDAFEISFDTPLRLVTMYWATLPEQPKDIGVLFAGEDTFLLRSAFRYDSTHLMINFTNVPAGNYLMVIVAR